jgi:hypothetical protein
MPVKIPFGVSLMVMTMSSPGFIRNVSDVGVKLAAVKSSGPAGPPGTPLFVRKAKAVGSRQLKFSCEKSKFPCRLLMCSDAHQCSMSQENWVMNGGQPGG